MSEFINVTYEVPNEIAAGLLNGTLTLMQSVAVRDYQGIVAHVHQADLIGKDEAEDLADAVTNFLADNKDVLKGAAAGAGLTVVGYGIYRGIRYLVSKKKVDKLTTETIENSVESQVSSSMCSYLNAIASGNLDEAALNEFSSAMEGLNELNDGDFVELKLDKNQVKALADSLYRYTKQLVKRNKFKSVKVSRPKRNYELASISSYLNIQKLMLEVA